MSYMNAGSVNPNYAATLSSSASEVPFFTAFDAFASARRLESHEKPIKNLQVSRPTLLGFPFHITSPNCRAKVK